MDEQIAAIRAALAAVEAALAQTEAALKTAADPQDVMALTSALVDLRAQRSALQLQLASLEAAAVVVQPLSGARSMPRLRAASAAEAGRAGEMRSLEKQLNAAVTDRRVSAATLAFAAEVLDKATTVRMLGHNLEPLKPAKPAGKGKDAGAASTAKGAPRRGRPK